MEGRCRMSASKNGLTRSVGEESRETSVKKRTPSSALPTSSKLRDHHRERLAVVYVRQSTQQQVVEHPESLARQYAMAESATALGWTTDRVLIIDEDLGLSGRSAEGRSG